MHCCHQSWLVSTSIESLVGCYIYINQEFCTKQSIILICWFPCWVCYSSQDSWDSPIWCHSWCCAQPCGSANSQHCQQWHHLLLFQSTTSTQLKPLIVLFHISETNVLLPEQGPYIRIESLMKAVYEFNSSGHHCMIVLTFDGMHCAELLNAFEASGIWCKMITLHQTKA